MSELADIDLARPAQPVVPGLMLQDVPVRFDRDSLIRLVIHATRLKSSDINIESDAPVRARINGVWHSITVRKVTHAETASILDEIYRGGESRIRGGDAIDPGWDIRAGKERFRFRVNAVGGRKNGAQAIQITMRVLAIEPPLPSEIGIDDQLLRRFVPMDGVVMVVGQTGSGKSTTMAAVIRSILEDPSASKKIVSFERPIEYVFDTINQDRTFIFQTEIGSSADLKTWMDANENAMRRAPDVIYLGETRDGEAVEAVINFAQSGHLTYTTFHASAAVDTFSRMTSFFPEGARDRALIDLIDVTRLVVWQRLFKRADGNGRIAVREFLQIDPGLREELLSIGADNRSATLAHMRKVMRDRGCAMDQVAERLYSDGLLSRNDYLVVTSKES